jgi:cobalt/nickel transport system permease protein
MRVAGNMAGQLFVRSYDRSDRIYSAMLSRGYTGNIRTLNPHTMKQSDWAIASTIAVFLVVTQMIGWIR